MIYIYRLLWLIGYVPIFILGCVLFWISTFTYPLVGAFYFVKTGDIENTPYLFAEPIMWFLKKYNDLANKIENTYGTLQES